MTCSIREGAETKIFERLRELRHFKHTGKLKTIILAGCMATRLKDKVLEKERLVDIVVGPDNYRDLPNLLAINKLSGRNAVNVILSMDETYAGSSSPSIESAGDNPDFSIRKFRNAKNLSVPPPLSLLFFLCRCDAGDQSAIEGSRTRSE